MAALVKQLVGVDEFLSNLQSLPSFHRVQELQLEKLMTSIKQKAVDDQGFAETSKAAEEMKHFDKDQKDQLLQSIVDAYDKFNRLSQKQGAARLYQHAIYVSCKCVEGDEFSNSVGETHAHCMRVVTTYRLEEPIRNNSWCHYCCL